MITKPQGYDGAPAYTGEFAQLPAGLYVCEVLGAKQEGNNGNMRLVMQFDIAEGEHKGFYRKQYKLAKQTDRNAKYKGMHRQNMNDQGLPFFKGLMTSIEKSNSNFSFPWGQEGNEKTLIGKKFGAVMGREQFLSSNGKKLFATKIFQIRSLDGLKDAKIPEDRLLDDCQSSSSKTDSEGFANAQDSADEPLPFM